MAREKHRVASTAESDDTRAEGKARPGGHRIVLADDSTGTASEQITLQGYLIPV